MTELAISEFLKNELFGAVCGKLLGSGSARQVYEHKFDPTVVIKFELNAGSFQNIIEWETWQRIVKIEELAKWFAPCVMISPNGAVLVQRRTRPASQYPDKVPAFFTDLKLQNFGVIASPEADDNTQGQFVCHDYGLHLMLEKGMTKRMRKADWWTL